jgi:hypothetical protein
MKRQSKKKNEQGILRREVGSMYRRFKATKIILNVGDYLPWTFSNTNLKTSKVGHKKKKKQNNVDHSSQLLLTQGVLCYSRRRKKKKSLLWDQKNKQRTNWR